MSAQLFCVGYNCCPASGLADSKHKDDDQRNRHNDALHEIRQAGRQKAARHRISDDNQSANNHTDMVIQRKQGSKQFPDRSKPGRRVWNKEDHNDKGRYQRQNLLLVPIPVGKVFRNRNRIPCFNCIVAKSPCNKQPVQIGSCSKANRSPEGFRHPRQIGKPRQAHQQPA